MTIETNEIRLPKEVIQNVVKTETGYWSKRTMIETGTAVGRIPDYTDGRVQALSRELDKSSDLF